MVTIGHTVPLLFAQRLMMVSDRLLERQSDEFVYFATVVAAPGTEMQMVQILLEPLEVRPLVCMLSMGAIDRTSIATCADGKVCNCAAKCLCRVCRNTAASFSHLLGLSFLSDAFSRYYLHLCNFSC